MTSDVGDGAVDAYCPQLTDRGDVRKVSALIAEVPGVTTVEVDLATRSLRVGGAVTFAALRPAMQAAGYTLLSGEAMLPVRSRTSSAGGGRC